MTDPLPVSHPLRVAALATRKPTRFDLKPDAAAQAALARHLGIDAISGLHFVGELRPRGRTDFDLEADLTATVVQPCIVSLVPVRTRIAEHVTRRYIDGLAPPEGDEVEIPEDDTEEPLPQVINLGFVLTEALALALPLYPRAPGAELGAFVHAPPGVAPLRDADLRPFAGLASLADRLPGPGAAQAPAEPDDKDAGGD